MRRKQANLWRNRNERRKKTKNKTNRHNEDEGKKKSRNYTYTEEMRSQASDRIFCNVRGELLHRCPKGKNANLTVCIRYPSWYSESEHLQFGFCRDFADFDLNEFDRSDLQRRTKKKISLITSKNEYDQNILKCDEKYGAFNWSIFNEDDSLTYGPRTS